MEITGQLTRQRALIGAGVLLVALVGGGKLLLGSGAASAPARVAGPPGAGGQGTRAGGAGAASAGSTASAGSPPSAASPNAAGATSGLPAASGRPLLVIHVVGAVRRPGLYRLAEGARAADALSRAGGPTANATLAAIDLAAPIADGQQVAVPRRDDAGASPAPHPSPGAGLAARMGPVHLNTATVEQLDALPGIGPTTAQKIVDYRQQHGSFRSVDELDAIPGIGLARIDQLRKLVAP